MIAELSDLMQDGDQFKDKDSQAAWEEAARLLAGPASEQS